MKHSRLAIALGAALLLGSCVPPKTTLTSSADKTYTKEPKRVMVVETVGNELGQYHETFKTTLAQRFQQCGATIDFMAKPPPDPLALDNSAAQLQQQQEAAALRRFSADVVLRIVQTGVGRTESIPPTVRLILYRIQLDDAQTGVTFWRSDARLFTAFDLVTVHDAGAAFADDLTKQLVRDGVFRSCTSAGGS